MKKLFVLILIIFLGSPVFEENIITVKPVKSISEIVNNPSNIYEMNILDKRYTCHLNNCYDYSSFHYNKINKTYYIDIIMDLMRCNAQQKFLSPYGDGYISHLIFKTKLRKSKINIKCKGFVVGDIVVSYKNNYPSSAHYKIKAIYKNVPKTVNNIGEFENISLDKDVHMIIIQNLADNLKD